MKYFRKDRVLEHFVHQIRNKLGNYLKQIVLFGAWARGDDIRGTDYDCLVVVDKVSRIFKEIIDKTAGEAPYEYNAVIAAFPVTEEKYQSQSYNFLIWSTHDNVRGTVLFDNVRGTVLLTMSQCQRDGSFDSI